MEWIIKILFAIHIPLICVWAVNICFEEDKKEMKKKKEELK